MRKTTMMARTAMAITTMKNRKTNNNQHHNNSNNNKRDKRGKSERKSGKLAPPNESNNSNCSNNSNKPKRRQIGENVENPRRESGLVHGAEAQERLRPPLDAAASHPNPLPPLVSESVMKAVTAGPTQCWGEMKTSPSLLPSTGMAEGATRRRLELKKSGRARAAAQQRRQQPQRRPQRLQHRRPPALRKRAPPQKIAWLLYGVLYLSGEATSLPQQQPQQLLQLLLLHL